MIDFLSFYLLILYLLFRIFGPDPFSSKPCGGTPLVGSLKKIVRGLFQRSAGAGGPLSLGQCTPFDQPLYYIGPWKQNRA